jgi:hypothetical protein
LWYNHLFGWWIEGENVNRTVFFSWQSDLSNTSNRNFIEDCIKKAIKEMKQKSRYQLILSLDRDTTNTQGTPDIANTIFEKIDKACFFIADISLINGSSRKYKKTPNPNVLLELGYAVHKLGWERVICLFNTDFGKLSDLPFDLRNRRIITYQTGINKLDQKKKLVLLIKQIFEENYKKTIFSNELMDYYNGDIYLSLLRLIMDFAKFLYGYENIENTFETINRVLSLECNELFEAISARHCMGFVLFKSYSEYVSELSSQLEKIVPIKNFDDDYYVPIIRLINTLRLYNKELNRRGELSRFDFVSSFKEQFRVLNNQTTSGKENRIVLLKKVDTDKGVVVDFGDFQRKDHIDNLLNEFILKESAVKFYSGFINEATTSINQWIDNNGGEFIIDETQLEIARRKS